MNVFRLTDGHIPYLFACTFFWFWALRAVACVQQSSAVWGRAREWLMKAMDNSTRAGFRVKWCSSIWNFSYPFWLVKEDRNWWVCLWPWSCVKSSCFQTQVSSVLPHASQSRGFKQQKELTPFISMFPVLIDGKAAQRSQDIFLCCKSSLKYWDTPCCFGHFVSKRRGSEEASCDCRKTPCEKTLKSL